MFYRHNEEVEVRKTVGIDPVTRDYLYEWERTVVLKDHADMLSPNAPVEVRALDADGRPFMLRLPREDVRELTHG